MDPDRKGLPKGIFSLKKLAKAAVVIGVVGEAATAVQDFGAAAQPTIEGTCQKPFQNRS